MGANMAVFTYNDDRNPIDWEQELFQLIGAGSIVFTETQTGTEITIATANGTITLIGTGFTLSGGSTGQLTGGTVTGFAFDAGAGDLVTYTGISINYVTINDL